MGIDDALMGYLEALSNLTLAEEEKQRLADDLRNILDYMARLGTLDTTDVPARSLPFDHVNAFREDELGVSLPRESVLANAPAQDRGMFAAPRAMHAGQ